MPSSPSGMARDTTATAHGPRSQRPSTGQGTAHPRLALSSHAHRSARRPGVITPREANRRPRSRTTAPTAGQCDWIHGSPGALVNHGRHRPPVRSVPGVATAPLRRHRAPPAPARLRQCTDARRGSWLPCPWPCPPGQTRSGLQPRLGTALSRTSPRCYQTTTSQACFFHRRPWPPSCVTRNGPTTRTLHSTTSAAFWQDHSNSQSNGCATLQAR